MGNFERQFVAQYFSQIAQSGHTEDMQAAVRALRLKKCGRAFFIVIVCAFYCHVVSL